MEHEEAEEEEEEDICEFWQNRIKNPIDSWIFRWKYNTGGTYRSNREVANIVGVSEESVRKSIYRTLRFIRESDPSACVIQTSFLSKE